MIQKISAPDNVVAFRALGEITREDYQNTVVPEVEHLVHQIKEVNFLMVLDTDHENFTADAWMEDAMLGLKNAGRWNRAAIVTDSDQIISFTNGFSSISPGEFRGYKKNAFNEALNWVEGNS